MNKNKEDKFIEDINNYLKYIESTYTAEIKRGILSSKLILNISENETKVFDIKKIRDFHTIGFCHGSNPFKIIDPFLLPEEWMRKILSDMHKENNVKKPKM